MRPVELLRVHIVRMFDISAYHNAVDQTSDESKETKHQEHDSQYPNVQRLIELYYYDKTKSD